MSMGRKGGLKRGSAAFPLSIAFEILVQFDLSTMPGA